MYLFCPISTHTGFDSHVCGFGDDWVLPNQVNDLPRIIDNWISPAESNIPKLKGPRYRRKEKSQTAVLSRRSIEGSKEVWIVSWLRETGGGVESSFLLGNQARAGWGEERVWSGVRRPAYLCAKAWMVGLLCCDETQKKKIFRVQIFCRLIFKSFIHRANHSGGRGSTLSERTGQGYNSSRFIYLLHMPEHKESLPFLDIRLWETDGVFKVLNSL